MFRSPMLFPRSRERWRASERVGTPDVTTASEDSSFRSAVRRATGNVSLYTLALVINGTLRLAAVPFVVRAIPAAVFGEFATLGIVVWVIDGLGDLGVGIAAVRLSPECQTAAERRSLF